MGILLECIGLKRSFYYKINTNNMVYIFNLKVPPRKNNFFVFFKVWSGDHQTLKQMTYQCATVLTHFLKIFKHKAGTCIDGYCIVGIVSIVFEEKCNYHVLCRYINIIFNCKNKYSEKVFTHHLFFVHCGADFANKVHE